MYHSGRYKGREGEADGRDAEGCEDVEVEDVRGRKKENGVGLCCRRFGLRCFARISGWTVQCKGSCE
ncbi:hypothetical protein SODALDRAFT_115093 [Sodiomyces alkalinus F11]|uniref:Uncharacterized protein n=1 Tax=Sodiomyces alkalinus (strain CBS 110278 / VKM F-3762 / F11) TaxID=1314773 RepID=A0A3N2Q3B3_SODAK|nr:hypothetical protein SODALDRAFT_115093 [Sodiomyces alkalinus F11]ROT41240.1 hypothetical protein SODALDRAFT_115093 [Sodiomyces alkalinus F11]